MRAMQLEPIESAVGAPSCGADELRLDAIHVGARHRARDLVARTVADRRRRDQRPIARREGFIALLPAELRRSFGAGVAQLQRDLGRRTRMNVIDDAFPRAAMLVLVHAGAPRADTRVRRWTNHLGEHQCRAAMRTTAEMYKVIVVGCAIGARVLRHW